MKTFLLATLVVLAAVGVLMYRNQIRHERQYEFAMREATIQQDIAQQHSRIASLCTHSQQVMYENDDDKTLDYVLKQLKEIEPSNDFVHNIWDKSTACPLAYRALSDDKAREQQLRKEYEQ